MVSIRVLVGSGTPLMCAGLKALLEQHLGAEVRCETTTEAALSAVRDLVPDVVLVVAPVLTIMHTSELASIAATSKVILVVKENTHRSVDALRVGVRAVLTSDASEEELLSVIRMIVQGDVLIMPAAGRKGLDRTPEHCISEVAPQIARRLTAREKEVLLLLTNGNSNTEIAEKLSVSMTTVRSHVHHLLRKLGVGSRGQAIALAYETGLVHEIRRSDDRP